MTCLKKTILFLLVTVAIVLIAWLFKMYVYIGTYVLPIAPHWVTQLPPNPPKPEIKSGEFKFKIKFSIDGNVKEVSDDIVCGFSGFEVYEVGGEKKRVYTQTFKNHTPFLFRGNEKDVNTDICIEEIDNYKVILTVPHAGWFLKDPDYTNIKSTWETPYLRIYNTQTKYYLYPEESERLLEEHKFEILNWFCDTQLENKFR